MGRPRPPGRRRVSQVAHRARVLRLLRREPVPHGHGDRARGAGLPARPPGTDRRERALRGPGLRRAPLLLGPERHVGLEPGDHDGLRGRWRDRAVRSQLPQVHRAGPGHQRGYSRLPASHAQPLRHHRADPAGAARAEGHRRKHRAEPAREGRLREAPGLRGGDELHLRWDVLPRRRCAGAPREQRGSHPFRRGVVRVRALQSDVPRPPRDARQSRRPPERRSDGVRDALDSQAARRVVPDVLHPHPGRPRGDRPRPLQRGLLRASEHVAALRPDRIERSSRRHDGRPGWADPHPGRN